MAEWNRVRDGSKVRKCARNCCAPKSSPVQVFGMVYPEPQPLSRTFTKAREVFVPTMQDALGGMSMEFYTVLCGVLGPGVRGFCLGLRVLTPCFCSGFVILPKKPSAKHSRFERARNSQPKPKPHRCNCKCRKPSTTNHSQRA